MKRGPLCRAPNAPRHPPLRTFGELCEELGKTPMGMVSLMKHHPAGKPEPRIKHEKSSGCWYDPVEFRRWFASIPK